MGWRSGLSRHDIMDYLYAATLNSSSVYGNIAELCIQIRRISEDSCTEMNKE